MAKIIEHCSSSTDVRDLLEAHIQSGHLNFLFGSGASLPAIPLAGNIEQEINKSMEVNEYDIANQKALEFIEEIEATNQKLIGKVSDTNIVETFHNHRKFLEIVDHILFERKNTLLPRQATIFTTNYDTFFEAASENIASVMLNDGFVRQSMQPTGFVFAPEKYFDRIFRSGASYDRPNELPGFNLVKMHGSLTWSHQDNDKIVFRHDDIPALTEEQKGVPEAVSQSLNKRAVILPNIRKFGTTVLERTYFDLLRLYSNCLEKENALLLVFGFSFADEHILDITRRALRNPTAQVIILAYSNEDLASYKESFSEQRNVLIVAPIDGEHIDFPVLNTMLESIAPQIEKPE